MNELLAADLLLVLHASFVAFVIFGLILIIAGRLLSWSWVRNRWFRIVHVVCIGTPVGLTRGTEAVITPAANERA